MEKRVPLIYPLDTTALIYPAIINRTTPMLFRLSATFYQKINLTAAQKALENILPRFPLMRTNLKSGLFWCYLEESFEQPLVCNDFIKSFNYNITKSHTYPFRLRVYSRRMTLETSHLVTDGKGALEFFKAILAEYLRVLGHQFESGDIITPTTPFHTEELEEMYAKYFGQFRPTPFHKRKGNAFIEPSPALGPPYFKITRYVLPLDQALAKAREHGVSLTTFLVAVYASSYQDRMFLLPPRRCFRKPIRITTPANLRALIKTKTLRNFIALINLEIDSRLGVFSFEEILNEVHHSMKRDLTDKRFQPFIRSNVGHQRNLLLSSMPLFIKNRILRSIHRSVMKQETSVLSNLGEVVLPAAMADLIESFDFVPSAKTINKRDAAVISYKNLLVINICRVCESDALERLFYDTLCDFGLTPEVSIS